MEKQTQRQVSLKEFAQKEYKSYILIDFFKVGDDIKDLFKNYKDNLDMLFTYLAQAYIVHTGDVEKDGDYRIATPYPRPFRGFFCLGR